ncbi:MAG: protein ImuB [Pseudohongiellaceae bacterium]
MEKGHDESDTNPKLPLRPHTAAEAAVAVNASHTDPINPIGQTLANRLAALKSANTTITKPSLAAVASIAADVNRLQNSAATNRSANSTPKHKASLWYALYFPQLEALSHDQQQRCLNTLAGVAESVSSTVSFHCQALVCEIRSSLKYFGGINSIHETLKQPVEEALADMNLSNDFLYGASPTVTGSLFLARSGNNALVYRRENLRSALGELSIHVMQLSDEQYRRLYNMGIRQLRDIWRLPIDGIRKRFGSEFVTTLNKALGKAPEPTANYLPPPTFSAAYDLPYELENLERLLPIIDEMLAQLTDFLTRRDLSTSHLAISLLHEKRSATAINISLRKPNRAAAHFLLLIDTHFNNLSLPAPVISVKLEVKQFDAFAARSGSLALESKVDRQTSDTDLSQFMEQLRARLGNNYVKNIKHIAEHCPEYASKQFDVVEFKKNYPHSLLKANDLTYAPRPIWLLEPPKLLTLKNNRLYHRKPIVIVNGPERIETYWWSGQDVRRDYYVAKELGGSRLWIYHECSGEKRWFLHGYFS